MSSPVDHRYTCDQGKVFYDTTTTKEVQCVQDANGTGIWERVNGSVYANGTGTWEQLQPPYDACKGERGRPMPTTNIDWDRVIPVNTK